MKLNSMFSDDYDTIGFKNIPRYYDFDLGVNYVASPPWQPLTSAALSTVVQQRAEQIAKLSGNLKLFWSGGIDSTLMVASILPLRNKNIEIYHTCESVRENPYFVDHINSFGVACKFWSDEWATPFDATDIVVVATSADEVTGSLDESFFNSYQDWLYRPWQDFFRQVQGADAAFVERCQTLFAQGPSDIKTTFDARWWFYFYIRHTMQAREVWHYNLENDFENNVVNFFNCAEFDNWAVENKSSIMTGHRFCDFKRCFKDEIYRYWPDDNYREHKQKVNSVMATSWARKKMAKFKQNYLFIYQDNQLKPKLFTPTQYPFISYNNIKQEMEMLNGLQ